MQKEEKTLRKKDVEEISFLNQLLKTLEEAEPKLETAYERKDYTNFNKLKKLILQIQKKISEITK